MSDQRNMVRVMRRQIEKLNAAYPHVLRQIPYHQWAQIDHSRESDRPERIEVWRSNRFLVQVFQEKDEVLRVSCNRSRLMRGGSFSDGITWDELQLIKREIGRGDAYAIEVFPPDKYLVNIANMRHLWILPKPLNIGWMKD